MRTGKKLTPIKRLLGSSTSNAFSISVSVFVPAPWTQVLVRKNNSVFQDHLWVTSVTTFSYILATKFLFGSLLVVLYFSGFYFITSYQFSFYNFASFFSVSFISPPFSIRYLLCSHCSAQTTFLSLEISSSPIILYCLNANDSQAYISCLDDSTDVQIYYSLFCLSIWVFQSHT